MSFFGSVKPTPEYLLKQRSRLYGEISERYEKIAKIDENLKQLKDEGADFEMPKKIKASDDTNQSHLEIREFSSVKMTKNPKPTSAGVSSVSKKAWTIPKMKEFCSKKKIECPKTGKRDQFIEVIRSANKVREMDRFMSDA